MNFFNCRNTPTLSLMIPGIYHLSRGRYQAALIWAIVVVALIPTVILGLIAWVLCYQSAVKLSKTWSFPPDSLTSALEELPMPSSAWIHAHTDAVRIQIPERGENEGPLRSDQRERILEMALEVDPEATEALGEAQAASLIEQLTPRQAELSKKLLAQFYSERSYNVSDSLVKKLCAYYSLSHEERKLREEKELHEEIKLMFES